MLIKIKKLREEATVPTSGSKYAAGYDLYACLPEGDVTIAPHATAKIGTGLAMAVPEGYFGAIFARSGLATKRGLAPANKVGVVDADYRGEIMVSLHNHGDVHQTIDHGERIAQLLLVPFLTAEFAEAQELTDTARGAGGFGSTGMK